MHTRERGGICSTSYVWQTCFLSEASERRYLAGRVRAYLNGYHSDDKSSPALLQCNDANGIIIVVSLVAGIPAAAVMLTLYPYCYQALLAILLPVLPPTGHFVKKSQDPIRVENVIEAQ